MIGSAGHCLSFFILAGKKCFAIIGSPRYIFVSQTKTISKKDADMSSESKQIDFKRQSFFIGIDLHKKNWAVTIRTPDMELVTLSMNPQPEELAQYLRRHYPNGSYQSVYQAGFYSITN